MTRLAAQLAHEELSVATGPHPQNAGRAVVVLVAEGARLPLHAEEARALGVALFSAAQAAERPEPDSDWP